MKIERALNTTKVQLRLILYSEDVLMHSIMSENASAFNHLADEIVTAGLEKLREMGPNLIVKKS